MKKYELRETVLDLLVRVGEQGGYSHLLIDHAIKDKGFDGRDSSLLTEIVYGTLKYKITLSYFLDQFVSKKLDPWVKWLLLSALYQLHYLDRVPDHAVLHESVEIAKRRGHKGTAGLVNGVLRNVQRKGFPDLTEVKDDAKRIALTTSHPEWLVERWISLYGKDVAEQMCQRNQLEKDVSVRVQPLRINRDEAAARLEAEGYNVEKSELNDQGLIIREGNVLKSSLFTENLITIQDQTSMLAGALVDAHPGMMVLDACSAPGGKTTHIAETMENEGMLFAYDLHEKKAKQVEKKAKALALTIVDANQADSRNLSSLHEKETFDRILLDAPCSGLGVLRGKPDIKYHKSKQDIEKLAEIQKDLLNEVAPLLKPDGKLVYSTCTVDKAENEQVVQEFLQTHADFIIDPDFQKSLPKAVQHAAGLTAYGLQIFPQDYDTDGFFMVRFIKTNRM